MLSVKGALACIDELKHNGFEDNQAKVLAMAIDETVGDRLERVVEHFDARFDGIDGQLKRIDLQFNGINAQLKGFDSELKGINAKLDSRKYQIVVIIASFFAALTAIGGATYVYVIQPLLG